MKSPELTEFFSLLGKAKKEKKEEFDNLLKEADINLDVLTSSVVTGIKEAKVNIKKQKKKEEKLIEQLDSIIDVIENPKEVKDITEPPVTVGVPEDFDVSKLEIEDVDDNPSFEIVHTCLICVFNFFFNICLFNKFDCLCNGITYLWCFDRFWFD